MTNDKIKVATGCLMEMFRTQSFPEAIAFTIIHGDSNSKPSSHWSLGNRILMLVSGTRDARGYRQWETVGRQVKKGAKAIAIFAPLTKTVEDTATGKSKTIIFGFRPIPVFRIEDTEGEPLPEEVSSTPATYPPFYEVAERMGIEVRWSPIDENAYGSFCILNNKITLHSQDAFIYFHELAHAIHNTFVNLMSIDRNHAEIVADIAAAVLCQVQRITGYELQTYKYVQEYCSCKDDAFVLKAIMSALSDVEMVVSKILDVARQPYDHTSNPYRPLSVNMLSDRASV